MSGINAYRKYFNESKYTNWYFNIIEKAKSENRKKRKRGDKVSPYYEEHHIVPKCIDPKLADLKKNRENSVLLTAREHILSHWLLCHMAINKRQEFQFKKAFYYICFNDNGGINQRTPSVYLISLAREKASEVNLGKKYPKIVPEWFPYTTDRLVFEKTITDLYSVDKMTLAQIAEKFGVSESLIGRLLKDLKVPKNTIIMDRDWLYKTYVVEERSIYWLKKELSCSEAAIVKTLKRHGIPIRGRQEALEIRMKKKNELWISTYRPHQPSA